MSLTVKQHPISLSKLLLGLCCLSTVSVGASATEYRLFVNDTAACSSAGVSGSVCLVAVGVHNRFFYYV
jgi:hypothetical protein